MSPAFAPFVIVMKSGVDLKLIKALEREAPGLLYGRVNSVQIETRTAQCAPLYEGQETCDEALSFMTSLGYRSNHDCPKAKGWCERTMQFYRRSERNFAKARAPPPAEQ